MIYFEGWRCPKSIQPVTKGWRGKQNVHHRGGKKWANSGQLTMSLTADNEGYKNKHKIYFILKLRSWLGLANIFVY